MNTATPPLAPPRKRRGENDVPQAAPPPAPPSPSVADATSPHQMGRKERGDLLNPSPVNGGEELTADPLGVPETTVGKGIDGEALAIHAPSFDAYDGYGRMALELVWHLTQKGVYTNVMSVPEAEIIHESQTDAIQRILQQPIKPTMGGLMLGYPTLRERYSPVLSAGPSVALTMFESTTLPEGWVESLNKCSAVIVPSAWNVETFRKAGVTAPIHLIPLGISESFYPVQRDMAGRNALRPYTFLTWGDRGIRKGWDLAFQAFNKAFAGDANVRLIIKAREKGFPYVPTEKHPNVEVLEEDLNEAGLMALYASVNCMVYPSRGEGFGLPPREFAATGGPVICTRLWADDIINWGYPVNFKMVKAWAGSSQFEGLGKWAEADIGHLAQQMQHVVKQNVGIIEYMGKKSARFVRATYSWEKFAARVYDVWQDPLNGETLKANGPAQGNIELGRRRRKERKHASNG